MACIIWVALYICTYEDTVIKQRDSWTGNINLKNSGVDKYHLIIWIHTVSCCTCVVTHYYQVLQEPCNVWGFSQTAGEHSEMLPNCVIWDGAVSIHVLSQCPYAPETRGEKCMFSRVPVRYHAWCDWISLMGCLHSSSTIASHHDRVIWNMLWKVRKKNSVVAKWLGCQSGHALSEPLETLLWLITLHPLSIKRVALFIALRLLVYCLFVFRQSPIWNNHSGVVDNRENMLEWGQWVWARIRIAMRWVTLWISFLALLPPAHIVQFSL
jgi:hypothetical protein